ncbi:MAG: DHH family phosphoesterase, partial [Candidatus Cloacimonetes bacterium]|nr:DHH family phosphoesterase [Candidatus Cloacimonadota bacterium]
MKFRWINNVNENLSIFEQILDSRSFSKKDLKVTLEDIPDISLLKDIRKAAERILQAVQNKEKIIIFGHDDLDGITSTYILFDFLEKLGSQNHYYYIPNRLLENHGIQQNFIQKVEKENFDLVITVDGGIGCTKAVDQIKKIGCEVIITDHHLVSGAIPNAFAVVNPKQYDCEFPNKMLAGVAVSFFLIKKIAELLDIEINKNYYFWVAVGSIADKVPLDGVNRILVKEVLDSWSEYDDPTLKILKDYIWLKGDYDSRIKMIKFIIRLFSNGREANGENLAMKVLLSESSEKNKFLQNLMKIMSEYEKKIEDVIEFISNIPVSEDQTSFIYFDENDKIPYDLLGYCASHISTRNKKPAIFLKNKNDTLICEARSLGSFNLVKSFQYCADHLIQFGGHIRAAGFTAKPEKLKSIIDGLTDYSDS